MLKCLDEMGLKLLCVEERVASCFSPEPARCDHSHFCEEMTSIFHILHEDLNKTMRYEQNKQFYV